VDVHLQDFLPITSQEFVQAMALLGPFEQNPHIAVAVSGGPDSLVLAMLLNDWAKHRAGRITGLIVDHRLRSESTFEADYTQKVLQAQGIEAHVLSWEGEKPTTRVQERARHKRYELLEQWCRQRGVLHLAIAHHAEDQWETVLYRLSKSSNLTGLCGMSPITLRSFGRMIRPLLGFVKPRIEATLETYALRAVKDPSNQNVRFTRVRWRKLYPELVKLGVTAETIACAVPKWRETLTIYQAAISHAVVDSCSMDCYGTIQVDLRALLSMTRLLQRQVLKRAVWCLSKEPYQPDDEVIRKIHEKLFELHQSAVTLHGCYLLKKKEKLLIMRELRAVEERRKIQEPLMYWDNRFLISVPEKYLGQEIGAVGLGQAKKLSRSLQIHSKILEGLPGIFSNEKLEAVLHDLCRQHLGVKIYCITKNLLIK
jgi:tRNA(Ile)-lysidine synthase